MAEHKCFIRAPKFFCSSTIIFWPDRALNPLVHLLWNFIFPLSLFYWCSHSTQEPRQNSLSQTSELKKPHQTKCKKHRQRQQQQQLQLAKRVTSDTNQAVLRLEDTCHPISLWNAHDQKQQEKFFLLVCRVYPTSVDNDLLGWLRHSDHWNCPPWTGCWKHMLSVRGSVCKYHPLSLSAAHFFHSLPVGWDGWKLAYWENS